MVPASLIANWKAEIDRFAPFLRVLVAHPSGASRTPEEITPESLAGFDLVVTTYGLTHRLPWLRETEWPLVVLDEAQAIKNPGAKQARAVKALRGRSRVALTGTPVENRLSDLWSIFDFLNPGLLGSARAFAAFAKQLGERPGGFAPLRELTRPHILRRLNRSVIADLPEKTELRAYCGLSKTQAALYQESVRSLAEKLESLDGSSGIERRGVVLAYLMRLKQICNHPSQWLRDGGWAAEASGKFSRLRELGEVIADKQEKALVFTQFREMAEPLAVFLEGVFGRPGLVMHGATPVPKRRELVARFQDDERAPFFVLSLKVGGTGLNLTAASHVIHFDRWWNPAVEDQATDRAFRIGQKKNVLVHKFVCRGTVEEKIDAVIEEKQSMTRGPPCEAARSRSRRRDGGIEFDRAAPFLLVDDRPPVANDRLGADFRRTVEKPIAPVRCDGHRILFEPSGGHKERHQAGLPQAVYPRIPLRPDDIACLASGPPCGAARSRSGRRDGA